MELQKSKRCSSNRVLNSGLMGLVNKIPNIYFSVVSSNHNDSWSGRTENTACDLRSLDDLTVEDRNINRMLPDTEIKVIQRKKNIREKVGHIKSHCGSKEPFILPNLRNHISFSALIGLFHRPIEQEHFSFI
jgi:hypothetical protein